MGSRQRLVFLIAWAALAVGGRTSAAGEPADHPPSSTAAVPAPEADEPPPPAPPPAREGVARLFGWVEDAFAKGGIIMWALLATSLVATTFALERFAMIRRSAHLPARLTAEVEARLRDRGPEAAREFLKGRPAALARMYDAILARRGAPRLDRKSVV